MCCFQGGPLIGQDYSNQAGTSIQAERGAAWALGLPEKAASGALLPGPAPLVSGQTSSGTGGQPPRPPPVTIIMAVFMCSLCKLQAPSCPLIDPVFVCAADC